MMRHNDLKLHAGPLSMIFERDLAFLRYVKLLDREVLRGIYCAVRDPNWGTIAPRVSMIEEQVNSFSFRLVFNVEHLQGDIRFKWRGEVSGDENGTIEYSMRGAAQTSFLSNRVGFCVLHPNPKGSHLCVVEHTDGGREDISFPHIIMPHQPFKDVRAIENRVYSRTLRVEMSGEIFETEDQRNWTDNSFKTYCRPHEWPRPFEVEAGKIIEQSVKVSLVKKDAVEITVENASVPLPQIGLQLAPQTHSVQQIEALRKLNLSHLRVDLGLSKNDVANVLQRPTSFDLPLEIALFLSDSAENELRDLVRVLDSLDIRVARWLVFNAQTKMSSHELTETARRNLSSTRFAAPIGGGTDANFTELNRNRDSIESCDFASYSMNPQVHAFDDRSMVETLECQAATLESARQFCQNKDLVVSPVTLLPRFNAVAIDENGDTQAPADARQSTIFNALWTMGSLKYLAQGGASSVTFFETIGPRGVMNEQAAFPVYKLFETLTEYSNVVPTRSSQSLGVESLMLQNGNAMCILLANFAVEEKKVRWHGIQQERAQMEVLDEQGNWQKRGEIELSAVVLPPQSLVKLLLNEPRA